MAHSLEIRVPFVDVDLIEALAPALPRFGGGAGKAALAGSPVTPLPDEIAHRAKSGFGVPTGRWMEQLVASDERIDGTRTSKGLASRQWAGYVAKSQGFAGFTT
jgi:asparagine synthase (glutamine-hydrolysing)